MKKGLARKSIAMLIGALMVVTACVPAAMAASSNAPKFQKIEYDKNGEVDVDFYGNVKYKSPKITVKDSSGNAYTAKITDRENYDDDMEFKVYNIRTGRTYTFTISGIKKVSGTSYTSVTGKFYVPSNTKPTIKDVEYDDEDREVSFEFRNDVYWKYARPLVKITTMSGTAKTVKYLSKDRDEIEVRAKLTPGVKYKYTIYSVKARGGSAYQNVSGTFRADYDD